MEKLRTGIAVLGAGSWGTALAILLARNGESPVLWGRDASRMEAMAETRHNEAFLPEYPLSRDIGLESDLETAVSEAQDLLLVVPSHAFRGLLHSILPVLSAETRIAWATKGFEPGSGKLLHQVAAEETGPERPLAVLSGPSFAAEVAADLPGAVTIASRDECFREQLAARFHSPRFRVYSSDDVVGVQVGGAVKNVLAIAAGIADGLGYGANARAALITRGLAELMRLGEALGGRRETLMGLSGLGDLVLTCTDDQSRNRQLGLALARGMDLAGARRHVGRVTEGADTVYEVVRRAKMLGLEVPISQQVARVLDGDASPEHAVESLLRRDSRPETLS